MGLPIGKLKAVNWLRVCGYGAIVVTIVLLALWALSAVEREPETTPVEQPDAPAGPLLYAGWESRLASCDANEFFVPAVLPWSLSNIKRLPSVEVISVTLLTDKADAAVPPKIAPETGDEGGIKPDAEISSLPQPEEAIGKKMLITGEGAFVPDPEVNYVELISDAVVFRLPPLFRPFELKSSPPYLVTPATVELDFYLGPDGDVAKCSVRSEDITPELQEQITERALRLSFPTALAFADFTARVRIVPYASDRLTVERSGRPVGDEEYRLVFRTLQYSSYYLTVAMQGGDGELLYADTDAVIAFRVDNDGVPYAISVEPVFIEREVVEDVTAAISYIRFPADLAGSDISINLGAN
ncbi:MAG: hypothetical protein GY771_08405 [bacterium]|nr:hypothetical protein [bacterium]